MIWTSDEPDPHLFLVAAAVDQFRLRAYGMKTIHADAAQAFLDFN